MGCNDLKTHLKLLFLQISNYELNLFSLFQLTKDLANHKVEGQPKAETAKEKLSRKFTENPFIPLGMLGLLLFALALNSSTCRIY